MYSLFGSSSKERFKFSLFLSFSNLGLSAFALNLGVLPTKKFQKMMHHQTGSGIMTLEATNDLTKCQEVMKTQIRGGSSLKSD